MKDPPYDLERRIYGNDQLNGRHVKNEVNRCVQTEKDKRLGMIYQKASADGRIHVDNIACIHIIAWVNNSRLSSCIEG